MLKFSKEKIKHRQEEFGGLVCNTETGTIYKLNKIAYRIFLDLFNRNDVEILIDNLENEFEEERWRIRSDVEDFINELVNRNLASQRNGKDTQIR